MHLPRTAVWPKASANSPGAFRPEHPRLGIGHSLHPDSSVPLQYVMGNLNSSDRGRPELWRVDPNPKRLLNLACFDQMTSPVVNWMLVVYVHRFNEFASFVVFLKLVGSAH
jgi:hypothetical protein